MGACFSSPESREIKRARRAVDYYHSSARRAVDNYHSYHVSPILEENYARDFRRQEAPFSSRGINHRPQVHNNFPMLIQQQEEPEIKTEDEPIVHIKLQEPDQIRTAESSSRKLCMICMDEKPSSEIFRGATCSHLYCTECTIRYVETKIGENVARIKCPDMECTRELQPYMCSDVITSDMLERWHKNLCDSLVLSWDKLYCPFEGCSAMMIVDDDGDNARVMETECPTCHRLFCAQCKVPWHAGIGCEEFQRVGNPKKNSDDVLIEMAKSKQWRRCPHCKFYVEKTYGCLHITCRCGYKFCYGCGTKFGYLQPSFLHACPKPDATKV